MRKKICSCTAMLLVMVFPLLAQKITIRGTVRNGETGEPMNGVSVSMKGSAGHMVATDSMGHFRINVASLPVSLLISHTNFQYQELVVGEESEISVDLHPQSVLLEGVVLKTKGIPTRVIEAPFSAEYMGLGTIRQLPTTSFYDGLSSRKGVGMTTSSLTFKTPSTRGFNGSGSSRVNQIVDGMDNQAPGLNFFVGNFTGPTEIDIESMELLPGASSALYGPGGMNGTILLNSKNPFQYPGLEIQIKPGVMNLGKSGRGQSSMYHDYSFRWAKNFKDKFAFKIGAQYVRANDWLASDTSNYLRSGTSGKLIPGTRKTDPGYDGVNVYGDETSIKGDDLKSLFATGAFLMMAQNPALAPELSNLIAADLPYLNGVSRTGYQEAEVIDPVTKNIKISGALHYKLTSNIEAQLMANWSTGNTVFTDDNRYALKGIKIGQYKLELKHKNWFFRTHTTQEDAGKAYSATVATQYFNEAWKRSFDPIAVSADPTKFFDYWYGQYIGAYWNARLNGTDPLVAHNLARAFADQGRPEPGSAEFKKLFDHVRSIPIPNGGLLKEKSQLWMTEGQYSMGDPVKSIGIIVGGNYKKYILNSGGTLFIDTAHSISTDEIGAYTQLTKKLFHERLTLMASGRFDKNENFKVQFTPRFAALVRVAENNNLRLSYQTAYRFPSNLQQWVRLSVGGDYLLLGGLPWVMDYMNSSKFPVYKITDGIPENQPYQYRDFKPETMRSFEIGYKGLISQKLLVDAYAYLGKYEDFIGRIGLYQPATQNAYSITVNSSNRVKTHGYGLGLDYSMRKNYFLFFNIYSDVITDVPASFKSYFNSPKYRLNAGFANSGIGKAKRAGFNIMLQWQDSFMWEGELANGPVNAAITVDAQVNYEFPRLGSMVKLGGTNILNHYYKNGFANPQIGALYYVSFDFSFPSKKN